MADPTPITVEERFDSGRIRRGRDGESHELVYVIKGTNDADAAIDALEAAAPLTHRDVPRDGVEIEPIDSVLWEGRVTYTHRQPEGFDGGEGPDGVRQSFSVGGSIERVTHAIDTLHSVSAPGSVLPDFQGAINVQSDGEVAGVDVPVTEFVFELNKRVPAAEMTNAYIRALFKTANKVNESTWRDLAAGEALFHGVSGSRVGDVWDLTFLFAVHPNRADISIGTGPGAIVVPSKQGWDYLWVYYAATEQTEGSSVVAIVPRPVAAYVQRVLERADFSVLGV